MNKFSEIFGRNMEDSSNMCDKTSKIIEINVYGKSVLFVYVFSFILTHHLKNIDKFFNV